MHTISGSMWFLTILTEAFHEEPYETFDESHMDNLDRSSPGSNSIEENHDIVKMSSTWSQDNNLSCLKQNEELEEFMQAGGVGWSSTSPISMQRFRRRNSTKEEKHNKKEHHDSGRNISIMDNYHLWIKYDEATCQEAAW